MVIMIIFRSRREERDNNREAAYIQAITAAAVTHTLTRNCSQGSIPVSEDIMKTYGSDECKAIYL